MVQRRSEFRMAASLMFICLIAFAAADETTEEEDSFYGITVPGLDTPAPTTAAPTPAPTFAPATPGCEDDPDFLFRRANPNSDCTWVARLPQTRCLLSGVSAACLATCGTCPTAAPTVDPYCFDDPDYLFKNKAGKDCTWVARNSANRCKRAKIAAACQKTCDTCVACEDDADFFLNANNPQKTCAWAAKRPARRCNSSKISAACPATCGTC